MHQIVAQFHKQVILCKVQDSVAQSTEFCRAHCVAMHKIEQAKKTNCDNLIAQLMPSFTSPWYNLVNVM